MLSFCIYKPTTAAQRQAYTRYTLHWVGPAEVRWGLCVLCTYHCRKQLTKCNRSLLIHINLVSVVR